MISMSKLGLMMRCPGLEDLMEYIPRGPSSPSATRGHVIHRYMELFVEDFRNQDGPLRAAEYASGLHHRTIKMLSDMPVKDTMALVVQYEKATTELAVSFCLHHGSKILHGVKERGYAGNLCCDEAIPGTLDLLLESPEKTPVLLDYKTGSRLPMASIPQLMGLASALPGDGPIRLCTHNPKNASFNWHLLEAERREEHREQLRTWLRDKRGTGKLNLGDWCHREFCPARNQCPEQSDEAYVKRMEAVDELTRIGEEGGEYDMEQEK